MKDLIGMQDLSEDQILSIINLALGIKSQKIKVDLKGKSVVLLFLEPSTRTSGSFDAAAAQCGAMVRSVVGKETTSFQKGETLSDALKIHFGYGTNFMVIRSKIEGFSRRASELTEMSIINGGDGTTQHPSQALLDLVSIKETQGTLENLKIAIVGDLRLGRTVHSLVIAMSHFKPTLYFVSPDFLGIPKYYKLRYLDERGVEYHNLNSFEEIIGQLDILYMTRMQKERFATEADYNRYKNFFRLTAKSLHDHQPKDNLRILHPLPRVEEIASDVDETPYAYYFEQAVNGLHTRKAIFHFLLQGGVL